ncbi:hypothetical protein JX266_013708 [Neoarthrinium moseri]|nr:hypothetical protein JX266_013708 [Neoarthrinium moseri]
MKHETWPLQARRCLIHTSSLRPRPATSEEELRYPDPSSKEHHDVPSYEAYATRIGLDKNATVYVGTRYEYTVAAALRQFGFDLTRIGRAGDYGIDLLGTWAVPSAPRPLRVLLQCKVSSANTRIGPSMVREIEGAFTGAPPGWRGSSVIGLLVTHRPSTKGIRESLGRSKWPMGFISCSSDGAVQQMLWNSRAEEEGLAGMGIGVRLSEASSDQELVLTWKGKPVPSNEQSMSQ